MSQSMELDALGIWVLLYAFPKWHQIRERLGYGDCYSDNVIITLNDLKRGSKDKVWLVKW